MDRLQTLTLKLREFAEERDWNKFHSPKNLAMAISVEAAELMEQFQWLSEHQSQSLEGRLREKVEEEVADVFIYVVRLADRAAIDLFDAAEKKLAKNAEKYPAEKVRGRANKYDEY